MYVINEVATENAEERGETRNSRLQLFLLSLFPSLEGVFGNSAPEIAEKEELMAARAVVPQRHMRLRGVFLVLTDQHLIVLEMQKLIYIFLPI